MLQRKQQKESDFSGNNYLKYSQLGFQLFITIGLCGWLGNKMDQWWNNGHPLFIIIMVLAGTAGAFYKLYRTLSRD